MSREIKFRAWNKKQGLMHHTWSHLFLWLPNPMFVIMQFTGLKDKNGKEIYEGDILEHIVKHNPKQMGKTFRNTVEYFNGNICGWRIRNKSFHFKLTENWLFNQEPEVIGNIHENPELLK